MRLSRSVKPVHRDAASPRPPGRSLWLQTRPLTDRSVWGAVGSVKTFLLPLIGAVGFLGVTGCLGDPPPDPATAPLEVVASGNDVGKCALNREEVAAGRHEVVVITEGTQATVELHDEGGKVLFRQKGDTWPQSSEDETMQEVTEEDAEDDSVKLAAGEYTFVCRYRGGPAGVARLTVVPN